MSYSFEIVPKQMNPTLSADLEREVRFFLKWGYLIVDNAITEPQVQMLRHALEGVMSRKQAMFTHQLLEEDEVFSMLLDNDPILTRIKAIMGNCIQLHSATARVTVPGDPDQDWHRDHPWPIDSDSTPYGANLSQINCGYYLDELTNENGPIVIVPGSHRVSFRPPVGHPIFPDEMSVLAKPGQAVLFDGSLFHRGSANRSDGSRRACLFCYQNAWVKSRETFTGPMIRKLRENGSPEVRMLLGEIERW
ncbi:phytanoyl-CoA dioxygenase family protein [Paenibacillus spongiae]|uniref:Phytanoyl-CoA dioxygenase family protein n=1 Tax=Paenibacillus spongiae TaxID=2909671 RepID=A0ABY5S6K2_9BACL|nr:phytanoyl-CoA dioxygenase family protein [Paenibacillus spongiae]UVI29546.1 phytanoyl-CoA dioxygenase family protein [Paenibacillus spongiae]